MNRTRLLQFFSVGFIAVATSCQNKAAPGSDVDNASLSELVAILQDSAHDSHARAAERIGEVISKDATQAGASEGVGALRAALSAENSEVRQQAARALGRIGAAASEALPDLSTRIRSDDDNRTVAYSIEAIGQMGSAGQTALSDVISRLEHNDPHIRHTASKSIGKIGGLKAKEAVPTLAKLLQDEDSTVQRSAAEALSALGPHAAEAVPNLTEATKNDEIVIESVRALGEIGPEAKPSLPVLLEIVNAERRKASPIWLIAAKSVAQIDPESAQSLLPDVLKVVRGGRGGDTRGLFLKTEGEKTLRAIDPALAEQELGKQ